MGRPTISVRSANEGEMRRADMIGSMKTESVVPAAKTAEVFIETP